MLDQIRTVSYCEVVVLGYRDDGQIIYMTVVFCYGVKVGMRLGICGWVQSGNNQDIEDSG